MIQIAIVEDSKDEQQRFLTNLKCYADKNKKSFQFSIYDDTLAFLEERKAFNIVFMDIIMPHISGMDAAARLREYDKRVVLIFVTTMAQFAAGRMPIPGRLRIQFRRNLQPCGARVSHQNTSK